MYDTTIMLKPREKWRPGMSYEKLIQEMDAKLQFPGLSNTWTMPVENRLDMELTGIKTRSDEIQGPTLEGIQQVVLRSNRPFLAFRKFDPSSPNASRKASTSTSKSIARKRHATDSPLPMCSRPSLPESAAKWSPKTSKAASATRQRPLQQGLRDNVDELRKVLIGTPRARKFPSTK